MGNDKTKIAVLVSGGGTNLQALIDAEQKGIIKSGTIALVISNNPNAYALKRAENANIPCAVVSKKELGSQEAFEAAIEQALADHHIDLIVLAGFMSILSAEFTAKWPERIINVHPALIPSFCGKGMYGLAPHIAALEKGVKVTGATVHFVNEIPDGGKILMQKAVSVEEGDTPEILQRRVMEQAEWIILPQATEMVSAHLGCEKSHA
jgi:phosphoribosylglycinamide formyltransferase-1